ncbi:uncharacterized protein [Aristolochia californica]|uniref:uncharacterized protein n=1 Tax=Aristolochia californica TaxID=171875 RepID=UPI0035DF9B16
MSNNLHRTSSTLGVSRKRKEREGVASTASATVTQAEPTDNRLLAGYLAHEFLTNGTLFGQKWDPARAEAAPLASPSHSKRSGRGDPKATAVPAPVPAPAPTKPHGYADMARLLKTDGAYIPGIINPTELALWLQI